MRNKLISKEDVVRRGPEPSELRRLWWRTKWKLEEVDLIPRAWKYKYWDWVAYDYRPKELWYRITCKLFKKYSTVKSRYLDDRWVDRTELMSETMFQILSDFVENECVESVVDWYHDEIEYRNVLVNNVKVNPMDEMLALYNWYHLKYKKTYKEIEESWWDKIHNIGLPENEFLPVEDNPNLLSWDRKFKSEEHERLHDFYMDRIIAMETLVDEELQEMLKRLIEVRRWMWT